MLTGVKKQILPVHDWNVILTDFSEITWCGNKDRDVAWSGDVVIIPVLNSWARRSYVMCISTTSHQPLEGLARDRFLTFPAPTLFRGAHERKIRQNLCTLYNKLTFFMLHLDSLSYVIMICQPYKKPLPVPCCIVQRFMNSLSREDPFPTKVYSSIVHHVIS